jgi:alkylation response protein AidB-like acyl-CoA dehydrogenase
MNFELDHEHRMLADLVTRFVDEELIPLEKNILAREAAGQGHALTKEEYARVDRRSRDLGLWGLDAPEEMGGSNLPVLPMVAVNEAIGRTIVPYTLPPDSPNLRMLMITASPSQKERYLEPYARGEMVSAIAISEPGQAAIPPR